MYYSRLLDTEAFAQVVGAAPDLAEPPVTEARMILQALQKLSLELTPQVGMDGKPYWMNLLAELPGLPESLSPHRRGRLCREMGLVMYRRNNGYCVAWNGEQLALLLKFFQVS